MEKCGVSVYRKKMRHEWEKVDTFMSIELDYMGSGRQGRERKCVKGGR